MRLCSFVVFIVTGFLASGSRYTPIQRDAFIPSSVDTTNGIIIQNYGPKGNGSLDATGKYGYNDPAGKNFGYVVFWTRVRNETSATLKLTIHFPADSFAVPGSPHSYVKLYLPPDIMTPEKDGANDYGLTGLKSFLDTNFNKPTRLQKTINPKEELLFYVVLINKGYNGVARAGLVLTGQNLFYKTNILDSFIPCGHVVLKLD